MKNKKKVSYYYDPDIGQYYYGQGHPMKPHRVRMAHSLILHYGLYEQMECYRPVRATAEDMTAFHADDYVSFLRTVTPDRLEGYQSQLAQWNMLEDCPAFPGLWPYCQMYTGASLGAAVKLNYSTADIAINWMGGLHHAKKAEASGFCYVNDIVLSILELLKYHQRVLYIDIDVHHGDGVEEAFSTTDRVMTVSFHKFGGGFFPGTGDIVNVGHGRGKYYSLNVPLKDGVTDDAYQSLFKPVMAKIMEVYRPEAVVLQCGADSLAGDRLGVFNLSSRGHAACVEYMKSFNVPLMLVGGGGYKITSVSRCWAYETGVALGVDMDEALPPNEYYESYSAAGYKLIVQPKENMRDENSKEYLANLQQQIMEYLRHITPAPSVAFHERPPDGATLDQDFEQILFNGGHNAEGAGGNEDNMDVKPSLWDGLQGNDGDNGGGGSEGGGRSRIDMSFKVEDGVEEASPVKQQQQQQQQMHHRSPQMLKAGSSKAPHGHKVQLPSMLRPTAAAVKAEEAGGGEKSEFLTDNDNATVEEELNGGLGEEDVEMRELGGDGVDSAA